MTSNENTKKEYHDNGKLRYIETIVIIDEKNIGDCNMSSLRVNNNGEHWHRKGRCAKYHSNGNLAWELIYNNKGVLLPSESPTFREDGTVIVQ